MYGYTACPKGSPRRGKSDVAANGKKKVITLPGAAGAEAMLMTNFIGTTVENTKMNPTQLTKRAPTELQTEESLLDPNIHNNYLFRTYKAYQISRIERVLTIQC